MKRASAGKTAKTQKGSQKRSGRRKTDGATRRREAVGLGGSSTPSSSQPALSERKSHSRTPKVDTSACYQCSKELSESQRALFVEEEVGRIFCSEACIAAFFTPEIERLEKEYFKRLSSSDLTGDERENLDHLRWITLQEPDEVWMEKTLSGDHRFTLISEFQPGSQNVWCICICLFLRGEPSFLYLAFPTKNSQMVHQYRKGERVEWVRPAQSEDASKPLQIQEPGVQLIDRLAEDWTEEETLRAQLVQERSSTDIPAEEFGAYQSCLDETLEAPDEVWSYDSGGTRHHPAPAGGSMRFYHFIRFFDPKDDQQDGVWYVIIARETEDDEQIEILDAFPTRDTNLVDRYRRGEQEVGHYEGKPAQRVIH